MRASFGVAIGISAIDALLCAFTAITVLALVIVSPTVEPHGSLADDITMIEVQKEARGTGLSTKLLLDIQSAGRPQEIVQIASAQRVVTKYDDSNAHLFASNAGRIEWTDSTCGGAKCVSILTVTAAQMTWKARFRLAGDASSEIGSEEVQLTIRKLRRPGNACERPLSIEKPVTFEIDFKPNGGITC